MLSKEDLLISNSYVPEKVSKAVILLHGFGADSDDMMGLVNYFAPKLPEVAFYCPDAPSPVPCYSIGRQWFPLEHLEEITISTPEKLQEITELMRPDIHKAALYINELTDKIIADTGLSASDVVLGGFSQGGILALYAGLMRSESLAGIIGFSTMTELPLADELRSKPPVLFTYGLEDEVLPRHSFLSTVKALEEAGVPLTVKAVPEMGHTIDYDTILAATAFLKQTLSEDN
ncbi:MAG: alpha/beta fold hydrolase [Alphaproteobacteria bacterium]|nr:alpha/beta fold hydrolase [Alphaproteobacteria bacterium]